MVSPGPQHSSGRRGNVVAIVVVEQWKAEIRGETERTPDMKKPGKTGPFLSLSPSVYLRITGSVRFLNPARLPSSATFAQGKSAPSPTALSPVNPDGYE